MIDDAELLRRYATERSEAAFAEFVRRYIGLVYSTALRRMGGDAHGAGDVTQHVFIAVVRHARQLARHPGVIGWLYMTTRNAALDHMRNEQRRRQREHEAHVANEILREGSPALSSASNAPEATGEWEELRPVLDGAMDELGTADREAVLLRFFEGRSFCDVGRQLRLTENAARMRVERALDKLHALLVRRGITSTAAALGGVLANQAAATMAAVPAGLAVSVTTTALATTVSTGAAATAAAFFGIMSTSKFMVGAALVVGVAGIGSAVYEAAEMRRVASALIEATRERDSLRELSRQSEARSRDAEQRAHAGAARISALESQVAANARTASSRAAVAVPAVATVGGGQPGPGTPGLDPMLNHPEYFRLSMQKHRASLGLQWGPLYKTLRLSPEQIAKFESNRAEFHQGSMELLSAAATQGIASSDPAFSRLAGKELGSFEKELWDMLGRQDFDYYQRYSRAAVRELVGGLAASIYHTDAPLNAEQGEQLSQLLITHTTSVPASPGSKVIRYETDWNAVGARAQTILPASQAAAFRTMIEGKKLQEQMNTISKANRPSTTAQVPGAKPGS